MNFGNHVHGDAQLFGRIIMKHM